jgi:hypothetical protein
VPTIDGELWGKLGCVAKDVGHRAREIPICESTRRMR